MGRDTRRDWPRLEGAEPPHPTCDHGHKDHKRDARIPELGTATAAKCNVASMESLRSLGAAASNATAAAADSPEPLYETAPAVLRDLGPVAAFCAVNFARATKCVRALCVESLASKNCDVKSRDG